MQYALVFQEPEAEMNRRNDPEQAAAYWGPWMAYSQALAEAGVITGGAALDLPAMTTSVTQRDGKIHIQDGPHAVSKEMLGGFMLIEVPDLDAALAWAARSPAAACGAVEVRPVLPMARG